MCTLFCPSLLAKHCSQVASEAAAVNNPGRPKEGPDLLISPTEPAPAVTDDDNVPMAARIVVGPALLLRDAQEVPQFGSWGSIDTGGPESKLHVPPLRSASPLQSALKRRTSQEMSPTPSRPESPLRLAVPGVQQPPALGFDDQSVSGERGKGGGGWSGRGGDNAGGGGDVGEERGSRKQVSREARRLHGHIPSSGVNPPPPGVAAEPRIGGRSRGGERSSSELGSGGNKRGRPKGSSGIVI